MPEHFAKQGCDIASIGRYKGFLRFKDTKLIKIVQLINLKYSDRAVDYLNRVFIFEAIVSRKI